MTDRIAATRDRFLRRANMPVRYHDMDFAGMTWPDTEPAEEFLRSFLAHGFWQGEGSADMAVGFLFDGPPGSGKTTLAARIGMELLRHAPFHGMNYPLRPVYFTRFDELISSQKMLFGRRTDRLDEGITEEINTVLDGLTGMDPAWTINLLIIDDAGKEYQTEYTHTVYENIVRRRFDRGLPTIITTNVPLKKWGEVYSPSVESFAREALHHLPILSGTDRRRPGAPMFSA